MSEKRGRGDRRLTGLIIIISLCGLIYFGIRAVSSSRREGRGNPFEYNIDHLKKIDASLRHYAESGEIRLNFSTVHALSIGPDDRIYIAGDSAIQVLENNGTAVNLIETGAPVHCLAVDGNGDIFAGLEDHIEVFNARGTRRSSWPIIEKNPILTSICLGPDSVFVADAGNLIVWKFDPSGKITGRIGAKDIDREIPGFIIPSPFFDISLDTEGFLWAANTGRHSMENYTLTGAMRSSWGEYSDEISGFCGCCNPIHFSILENGTFITAEKGVARIKVYNQLGRVVSIVAGPDQFSDGTEIMDLAVDTQQRIYVLDPVRKSIRIFIKESSDLEENL